MAEPAPKLGYTFAEHVALEERGDTRHDDDGTWTLREVSPPGVVRLSMGVEIPVAEVYRNALSA